MFLKGRHCLMKYTADRVRQGLAFLEQSVGEDPAFALGHVWLALGHIISGMGYGGEPVSPVDSYRAARGAAERALAIDPDLGDAHGALAFVRLVVDFDWKGSEDEFRRGLELSPGSDLMWAEYGLLLSALERYDEAIAAYRRAKELDPLTPAHASTLASVLLRARRPDEALDEAERLLALQPEFPLAHSNVGWARLMRGQADAGLRALEKAVELAPGNAMLLGQLGHAYALAGRDRQALELLEQMTAAHASPYHLAYVYTALGRHDEAVDCLERAFDERAGGIYGIKGSFLFAPLASHPGFVALLRRMNLEGPGRGDGARGPSAQGGSREV
jgi:tetratricopeptide (TPR) repeat protein